MKNLIFYLKSGWVIAGLLFIISVFGLKKEGQVFESKWDGSVQYQEPTSSSEKVGIVVVGLVLIFIGVGKKKQQLQNTPRNENNSQKPEGQ
jgi:hypothetical protein